MCELLNTVSLLKSELINDIIKQIKLKRTNKNCKNEKIKILLLIILLLKFLTEVTTIMVEKNNPKIKE